MCHGGVLIYTRKCLKALTVNFSERDCQEYVHCKLSSKNSGLLHILCIYRSPNSTIENTNNLNSLISKFSKLNSHLLLLGDSNYQAINWGMLGAPHYKELKRSCLIWILISHLGQKKFTSENIKRTFSKFISTVIYLIHWIIQTTKAAARLEGCYDNAFV